MVFRLEAICKALVSVLRDKVFVQMFIRFFLFCIFEHSRIKQLTYSWASSSACVRTAVNFLKSSSTKHLLIYLLTTHHLYSCYHLRISRKSREFFRLDSAYDLRCDAVCLFAWYCLTNHFSTKQIKDFCSSQCLSKIKMWMGKKCVRSCDSLLTTKR